MQSWSMFPMPEEHEIAEPLRELYRFSIDETRWTVNAGPDSADFLIDYRNELKNAL